MQKFLRACRQFFGYAFFFSFFINILQLTFSIYMLQVYDKVLTSFNLSTLAVITVAAVICLVVMALLEWIRSRLLVRAGIEFDHLLGETVLRRNLLDAAAPAGGIRQEAKGSLRDVQLLRNFLGGNAVFAFFDLPWMPVYFLFIFILHTSLGVVAVAGGALVFILGAVTERLTRKRLEAANQINAHAGSFTGAAMRNASIVRSMGMVGNISTRWRKLNDVTIRLQTYASRAAGLVHAVSKALRVGLQVTIYAVGAYLTVMHESTAGIMIAASIIMGRALAPIDQAMATYRQSLEAWAAYKRLDRMLAAPPDLPSMDLPAPKGELAAENLFLLPAGGPSSVMFPSACPRASPWPLSAPARRANPLCASCCLISGRPMRVRPASTARTSVLGIRKSSAPISGICPRMWSCLPDLWLKTSPAWARWIRKKLSAPHKWPACTTWCWPCPKAMTRR